MKQISELPIVEGFRCKKSACCSVHWSCPNCGYKGSAFIRKITEIFSVSCHGQPDFLFLVDARQMLEDFERTEAGREHMN